ncbi:hypothetical protein [Sphingobacterium lactis]|uniref:Uncharacterized protein n=1 Tax=Sphingobacterium lactis TaxID=797291 RepID=A0A1H6CJM4_9SPHI|nr:hypothetical protein [Sphingobacterium lactis]SEG72885.1 hypothetical protein SAMN05421877_11615 [Sphingobacterium lactis]
MKTLLCSAIVLCFVASCNDPTDRIDRNSPQDNLQNPVDSNLNDSALDSMEMDSAKMILHTKPEL